MIAYNSDKAHLIPRVRTLLNEHIREDIQVGIYDSYSKLIDMMLFSTVASDDEELRDRVQGFMPAIGLEQPLLARLGRHHEPGAFRITLSRVDPDTLNNVPKSCLTVATVRPVRKFEDIGETFTLPQIEVVAKHAMEIIQIDGIISSFGIKSPGDPGSNV